MLKRPMPSLPPPPPPQPLPKTSFSHGFINAADGRKMSKSFGNVIDPHEMLDKYPIDAFRFYLCSEAVYGGDLKFSEESMMRMYRGILVRVWYEHSVCTFDTVSLITNTPSLRLFETGCFLGRYDRKLRPSRDKPCPKIRRR